MDTLLELCGVSSSNQGEEEEKIDGQGNEKKVDDSLWIERVVGWLASAMTPYLKYCFHGAVVLFYYLIL